MREYVAKFSGFAASDRQIVRLACPAPRQAAECDRDIDVQNRKLWVEQLVLS